MHIIHCSLLRAEVQPALDLSPEISYWSSMRGGELVDVCKCMRDV